MGKYDKDRSQKELALRFCLAGGLVPFLEVIVSSASDLSDTTEVLTDLDVLGLGLKIEGGLSRILFDCKTTNKMSPVNRAFWASGVCRYTGCDDAFVVLKNRAVHNHRVSALSMKVDLHDEASLNDLGVSFDPAFNTDLRYQSVIDRWNDVFDIYYKNAWSSGLFNLARNVAPLTSKPAATFRQIIAALRADRGSFDPAKDAHIGILFDVLASAFVCWATMARDARRFFDPKMSKAEFEQALLYYLWGGKEAYFLRKEMRSLAGGGASPTEDFPAWRKASAVAALMIDAPHQVLDCAGLARDLSIRTIVGKSAAHDARLTADIGANNRFRQFCSALTEHLVAAAGLPAETSGRVTELVALP